MMSEICWPMWQVSGVGGCKQLGQLYRTDHGWSWDFSNEAGFSESLPWFIQDSLPQGFLGCQLANKLHVHADSSGAWSDDDVLQHIDELDLIGDLLIGQHQYVNFTDVAKPSPISLFDLASHSRTLPTRQRLTGGVQPKFIADIETFGDCIVKFSDDITKSSIARRWGDLLVAEKIASDVLRKFGIRAPETEITQQGTQIFLISRRFDRLNNGGRNGIVSLATLAAEFLGCVMTGPWMHPVSKLIKLGFIDECIPDVSLSWAFGHMIGNSDMHFGNISFLRSHTLDSWNNGLPPPSSRFALAPIYDMLPMAFAPRRNGTLLDGPLNIQLNNSVGNNIWCHANDMAADYWKMVTHHELISDDFKKIVELHRSNQHFVTI